MISFKDWTKKDRKRGGKGRNEQGSGQTNREGGYVHQQREIDRSNPKVIQPTVHVFAVPEL